jgi:protein SCO1/2
VLRESVAKEKGNEVEGRSMAFRQRSMGPSTTTGTVARLALFVVAALAATCAPVIESAFADEMADPHAQHHRMMMMPPQTTRLLADYKVPDLRLVRDDDKPVALRAELDDGRPVVLSFIYTTCTTICPVTSQTLADLQAKLGAARDSVHLVSISIDPEQDTPARLRDYARKFGAGPEWRHYTGTLEASVAAQKAFGVYAGDKMNHAPVTLLRPSAGSQWVRIEGFATSDQLLAELRHVVASR